RWPMYLRNVKQFLRSVEPGFDERRFGFSSIHDVVRQAQREGVLRVERNRQGILRIFPGDRLTQPLPPVERRLRDDAPGGPSGLGRVREPGALVDTGSAAREAHETGPIDRVPSLSEGIETESSDQPPVDPGEPVDAADLVDENAQPPAPPV